MGQFYDLVFAGYLQVWLHRAHLLGTRASTREAGLLNFFEQLLAEVASLAHQHVGAPALLATLRALAQRLAAGERLTPAALRQEVTAALYAALRQSTDPAVPRGLAPAGEDQVVDPGVA